MKRIAICAAALTLFSTFGMVGNEAYAGSSGWINAHELDRFSRKVLSKGRQMPTAIKCKNNNAVKGMSRKNTMVNVTYKPITPGLAWRWAWGDRVGVQNKKAIKDGYKRVSYGSFQRPSGLVIRCAIWHKKR